MDQPIGLWLEHRLNPNSGESFRPVSWLNQPVHETGVRPNIRFWPIPDAQ
jgi:hypothetical protein